MQLFALLSASDPPVRMGFIPWSVCIITQIYGFVKIYLQWGSTAKIVKNNAIFYAAKAY